MYASLATLAAAFAATASAFDCNGPYFSFYNRAGNAMSFQRLDPALFPGQESPHLHSFDGGNGLAADMSFDTTQDSSCTTARIKPDKSLYWRPTLFWNGNNTGYYKVPDKFLKVYYKFGDAGNVRANVTEFPEGFRMIAGDPFKRSDGDNPGGIRWACLGDNYSRIDSNGFPTGFDSCSEGLTSEITFPSCWNGVDMDPKNPSAHMAWPTAGGTGLDACPDTHKYTRFPSIFIEFWYDVSSFDGQYSKDSSPWALANGDNTGFGFHADFLNGWEKGVLAKATAENDYCNCGCGCGVDQMKTCFGADNVNEDDDADFKSCSASPIYGFDDSSPIEKLPGCNPIQSGPAEATVVTGPGCDAAAPTGSTGGNASSASGSASGSASATPVPTSKAEAADVSSLVASLVSSALPSISLSVPNKQEGDGGYGGFATTLSSMFALPTTLGPVFSDAATYPQSSSAAEATELPSLSLASSAGSPEPTAPAGGEDECEVPVYVTVTPTVYVTAGSANATHFGNTTSCAPTLYHTVHSKVTVTVPAPSGYKHGHGHGRRHHL